MFWFCLQILSEAFLILRRTERDVMKNVYWSSCEVPVFLGQILMKLEFLRQIFEKYWNIAFHKKSVQFEPSCSMRPDRQTDGRTDRETDRQTDGRTDMSKLIVVFRNFANTSENQLLHGDRTTGLLRSCYFIYDYTDAERKPTGSWKYPTISEFVTGGF